ncbi:MAG TPA: Gmad2 immunoglobulin-like domain-containing protein [Vitreimonas sp.]|uniref:Gmad2 immunoglobulin-like domain-containing protein n=1 Tax=Vitreimonas sp. TaxID=3069702 RepID=UPI002D296CDF|nr:Gmad2 immunoglobulin-like domain-containing protein [Vitreimonas sp.]HYD87053.1 Gmad2 immunoglobulin-like domain-containing protein [Vitreimonas sp.]
MRIALLSLALALAVGACTPPPTGAPPQTAPAAETPAIVIETPMPNARVTSPLRVEGTAPGDWFFEAVFPAQLRGADGELIAEAPAQAQRDWMTEAPVPYVAELRFSVAEETPATLVLKEDMPSGLPGQREISVAVVLLPAP